MEKLSWSPGPALKRKWSDVCDFFWKSDLKVIHVPVKCVNKEKLQNLLELYCESDKGLHVLIEETQRFLDNSRVDSTILYDLSVRIYSELNAYEIISGEGKNSIVVNYIANNPTIIFKQAKDRSNGKCLES